MTKFLNISTDITLGGNSSSDEVVSSQKAVKDYVDNNSGSKTLSGLTDTTISSPTDGQALIYDSNSSTWVNSSINVDLTENITYSELAAMVSGGTLVKGQKYRITDYTTTTVQTNTQSANHQFDLIVMATSPNTLDCQAKAVLHAGDTYFSNADLSKWQVWYDINNDTAKYIWADSTNGKGVIYRMIDEWGNDCPYDFKNIQFNRKLTDGSLDTTHGTNTWVYTFNAWNEDDSIIEDTTLITNTLFIKNDSINCYGNVIGVYRQHFSEVIFPMGLNDIVFLGRYSIINFLLIRCCYNTFAEECRNNTFGNDCYYNTFGNYCYNNTFGNYCSFNNFGNSCSNNTFGNDCYSNTFGNYCDHNTFGNVCYSNTFGNYYSNNTFGNYCDSNTFGNYCGYNTFGNYCSSNTLGSECKYITFGISSNNTEVGQNYYRYNIIENGNKYIRLYQTSGTAEGNNQLQNVYITQGVNNKIPWYDISTIARNLSYRTTVGKESDGTLRIYNEDDVPTLSGLTDTTISSPTDGQVLTYDNSTSKWVNSTGISGKADKVTGATNGDVAGLDANGNLTDTGISASDVSTAIIDTHTHSNKTYLDKIPTSVGSNGQVLTSNGSAWSWANVPAELPSITGNASKILAVNSGATGVEWITNSGGGASVPTPTLADAGKLLSVNSNGNYELVTIVNSENIAY